MKNKKSKKHVTKKVILRGPIDKKPSVKLPQSQTYLNECPHDKAFDFFYRRFMRVL